MTEENKFLSPDAEEEVFGSVLEIDSEQGATSPSEEAEDEGQISLWEDEILASEDQIPLWENEDSDLNSDSDVQISLMEDDPSSDLSSDSFEILPQDAAEDIENSIPEITFTESELSEDLPPVVFPEELTLAEETYTPIDQIPQRRRRIAEGEVLPQEVSVKKPGKKPGSAVSPLVEFVEIIVGALVAAILVLTLICRTGVVEGTSMVPTMYGGDRYIISDLFYTPEQGDIVVFRPEIDEENELWIKRVIAVAGQKVYINPETYQVFVDDKLLDEPYLEGIGTLPHTTKNPIVVPEGCVYVMGDNRGISHDSRYDDLGCVEIGQLAGRVILRFWPLDSFGFCE